MVRQHGDTLDMDVLNSMDVLHRNIQEALRMEPPLVGRPPPAHPQCSCHQGAERASAWWTVLSRSQPAPLLSSMLAC